MTATVLLVDDEPAITAVYATQLFEYETLSAHSGSEAMSLLDRRGEDVDVVLLDRRMPGRSGEAVLSDVRDHEVECRVAMVTAIAPDYDIVDMPFDDYVTKPVSGDELRQMVESLLGRVEYADALDRYYRLVAKHALLSTERPAAELRENERFAGLEAELRAVERELADVPAIEDHQQFQYVLRDVVAGD